VPQLRFPIDSNAHLPSLHFDGMISDECLDVIRTFFAPAQQANSWLTAPPQEGPPGVNAAQHFACLLRGKHYVEVRDGNGFTLHDRALAEVATALTALKRQWWKLW